MMSEINAKPRSVQRKTIVSLLVGGLAGGLASFAALTLIDSGQLGELGTSREIAIMVAVVYLVMAVSLAFVKSWLYFWLNSARNASASLLWW